MYPAESGVTVRSRHFLRFQESLIDHSSFNIGDIDFIEEVPVDFYLLLPMTTGFVRRVNDDLLDILVYDRWRQFRHIHVLLNHFEETVHVAVHFFLILHPFFQRFYLCFQTLLFFFVSLCHFSVSLTAEMSEYRKVQEQASSLSGVAKGLIRIGTFSSVAEHWIPSIIQSFQRDYPGIRYELLLGNYGEIEQWIFEGRVDCGFLRLPTKAEYETISLGMDEYVAVLPVDHPLTKKDVLNPHDLDDQPFMLLEHGGKTEVSELLEEHQVKPDIRFTTWDDYAILSMVESGLGIGVLPRLILRRIPYKVEIRGLFEPFYREIGLAMKDGGTTSAAVHRFVQYLKYRD